MTDWVASIGREHRVGEGIGWLLAGALVVGAHVGGGLWLTRMTQASGAQVVYEIDLAPVATAAPEPLPDTPPDVPMIAAPDLDTTPDEVEPDEHMQTAQDELPEFDKPDPLAEQRPDMPPQTDSPPEPPPVVEKAEAVIAPKVVPPPRPKKKKKTSRHEPAPRTAAAPEMQAATADKAATPAESKGRVSKKHKLTWEHNVNRHVAVHMVRWSNRLRAELRLVVMIMIDGAGRVGGVSIQGSTGDARADASLRSHASRLRSLPAPPDGKPHTLRVPVKLKPRG